MTCKELLIEGSVGKWYNVSTFYGEFNVRFDVQETFSVKLHVFSIASIDDIDKRIQVLEDMFKYAALNMIDKVVFRNNNYIMEVTIDILETRE